MTSQPASSPSSQARPQRMQGVVLCGRMRGSGFVDPQWLVLVSGRYLQLPEPLYRIVEAANGRRSLDGVAQRVTKLTGWTVRPEAVALLLARTLIPLGVIAPAAGSSGAAPSAPGPRLGRDQLALSLKRRMVGPERLDPFTRVLQVCYWPPLLIAVLVAAVLTLRWLFLVHGISRGIADAIAVPGHLLLVLVLISIGGAFHELGHAAALRYGGARTRGMGVGLYLIYPAFYTDVSENYRLGRWARVRTDLGGFYFNLIFVLVLAVLYALTGAEYLLAAMTLTVLDIVRQSLPFVRMDGYWALVDVTGIPDFFTTIVPFLRTLVPGSRWRGKRLPALHLWAKAVYVLYLLVTIPVLTFLLVSLVRGLPHLLLTAWGSFTRLSQELRAAWRSADLLVLIEVSLQTVLLALPTGGVVLVLWNLGRKLGRLLWRWSRPTPLRRVAGTLVAAGIVVLLVRLWLPPFRAGPPSPAPAAKATARAHTAPPGAQSAPPITVRAPILPGVPLGPLHVPVAADPSAPRTASVWLEPRQQGSAADVHEGAWQPRTAPANTAAGAPLLELRPDGTYCLYDTAPVPRCGSYHALGGEPGDVRDAHDVRSQAGDLPVTVQVSPP